MPNDPLPLDRIRAAGFDIYMRNEDDTYLLFTRGNDIGYLQSERLGGYSLSTVHKPSSSHGTGFGIAQNLSDHQLTPEKLAEAFIIMPNWAYGRYGKVTKWKDIEELRQANDFNRAYHRIA